MSFTGRGLITFFAVFVACFAFTAAAAAAAATPTPAESSSADDDVSPFSRQEDLGSLGEITSSLMSTAGDFAVEDSKNNDSENNVSLSAYVPEDKGHHGPKPMKHKKKKPMSKHKKKKQTFKDKLLPLLLIPFVIQTMLIPMFIMNLKMLAMKAMVIGKFAILLIVFNMIRSWSQNAHSTTIGGSTAGLMAQNYGYNGGLEFGSIFNGRR